MNDELRCGDCGNNKFQLFYKAAKGEGRFGGAPTAQGTLVVSCTKCQSTTKLRPAPPAFVSYGNLCGGWLKTSDPPK